MTQSVAEFTISLETPGIFTRRVGTGWFYVSSYAITGSTIAGALAANEVLESARLGRGKCQGRTSPNQLPDCPNCSEKDRETADSCRYYWLAEYRRIRISDGLPVRNNRTQQSGSEKSSSDSSTLFVPDLLTIYESRTSSMIADGLLAHAVRRLALRGGADPKFLSAEPVIVTRSIGDGQPCKKKPASVIVDLSENRLEKWRMTSYSSYHLHVNSSFRSAEQAYLYSVNAHSQGTEFHVTLVGDDSILNSIGDSCVLSIGGARARGYGLSRMVRRYRVPLDEYVEKRTREIAEGFDRIQKATEHYRVKERIGTVTGLSPLSLTDQNGVLSPLDALEKRTGIRKEQFIVGYYRMRTRPRWQIDHFVFCESLAAGYAAAFTFAEEPAEMARRLAKAEVSGLQDEPGHGWLQFNHPCHTVSQVMLR